MNIHVHVYDESSEDDDNLIDCKDLELIDTYKTVDTGVPGYRQYGFELDGKWIEIRVPIE